MSRFWQIICAMLLAIFGGIAMLPAQARVAPHPLEELAKYALLGGLVAVIWAVFLRQQLENRRITLLSLFVLIAMEAILLSAGRILNPF